MEPTTRPTHAPKDDEFTEEELAQYNGKDESKPVYVCIKGESQYTEVTESSLLIRGREKGTIFDVSEKREMYGPGKGYSIFAGKDASKGLGKSSLKPEDAVSDYSSLDEKELKVLDDWVRDLPLLIHSSLSFSLLFSLSAFLLYQAV